MSFAISLIIGLAAGAFLTYAVTFRSGPARFFFAAVIGALVLGWAVPGLLGFGGIGAAIILGLAGAVLGIWVTARSYRPS